MFKRVVVPADLTDRHQAGLNIAIKLAKQSGGELLLVHVVEVIHGLPTDEQKGFYGQIERAAQEHLQQLKERVGGQGIACQKDVVYGDRGVEIVQFASRCDADLIVMTAPHIEPTNAAVSLSSVSYKVALLSQCPILLVK